MSNEAFNKALWALQHDAGWAFWFPFIVYGVIGMWYLYRLAAAASMLGRVIRVFMALSYLSMIFIFAFNGLGAFSFHLLALASIMISHQHYMACKAAGKIKPPEAPTVLGRVVERMVEKPKVNA